MDKQYRSIPRYDLHCAVRPDQLCPAKVEIIAAASGDPTGETQIDSDLAERLVHTKFFEQDTVAKVTDGLGQHGDVTGDICPIRDRMNENPLRRTVLDLVRGGFRRVRAK